MQSYAPDNFSIQCAKKQEYDTFYETEIALRKQLKYPPFCDIIVINFNSLDEKEMLQTTDFVYQYLKKDLNNEEFNVFKPMPAPIDKIQNRYRYRIIIKGKMTEQANKILNSCLQEVYKKDLKETKVVIDVNPNNMS